MKVLVAYPIQRGRLFRHSLDSVMGQEWDEQLDFFHLLGGDFPIPSVDNVIRKYNQAREVVLKCGYDALFTVECDLILPRDALKRLAMVDADVAYGLYVWRRGYPWWNAYSYVGGRTARSFSRDFALAKASWGKVVEVKGLGNGCTLIHRHVLERFPFRKMPVQQHSCDWAMAVDCQEAGFIQKNDLSVICGHIDHMHDGKVSFVRWPDVTQRGLYRITDVGPIPDDLETNVLIYLKDMDGEMKVKMLEPAHLGDGVIAQPGEIIELAKKQAKQMVWAGVAEHES